MTRIFCLALAAFALFAGVASAKTHTVVVTSVSLDKSTVAAGGSLTATYKVKNSLEKTSNPRTARFFLTLSEDAKRGFKGARLDSTKTPKIAAGSTKTLVKPLTVPAGTAAGSYLVLACISGECKASGVRVAVTVPSTTAPAPDSADLSITPASYDFGGWNTESDPAEFVVTNTSTTRTAGPVDVSFDYAEGGGADGSFFAVDSSSCGMLVPASSCTLFVTFTSSYIVDETAARMNVTDSMTPSGLVFSDLSGRWNCFNPPGLRFRPTPRC